MPNYKPVTNRRFDDGPRPTPTTGRGSVAILICLAGVLTATAIFWGGCSRKPAPVEAPVMTVQVASAVRATIEREVTVDAILYPLHQADIVPKISAPVRKFYVNRGSPVRAGQLLAELENQDLAAAASEAKGSYEQAQATYRTAVSAGLPQEMQKAELDLKAAKETLDAQQKVFDNRQTLYQQGAIPRKDLVDATVALTQARNQFEITQKQLQTLRSSGNENALKAAQGALASAKGRYEGAQAQLTYSLIRSPIDGVVTDRPLYPGEMASAGSPLITVMDLSRVVARAHIAQQQAALLKAGDEATLTAPGVSGDVPAKVTLVSPALDANSTTVEVWAEAANSGGRLQPGSGARLTCVAEAVRDALVVPASALITAPDGATSVIVAGADGKPEQKTVKVGIRQTEKLQVTEGLAAGERVVTQGAFEIAQEDPDVLARTTLKIAAPKVSEGAPGGSPGKD